ncbi:MAG TPA: redox-regulated ATPase YchF [archaeon]|nr:redox-regulated ATPase YchF [archaeon]
MIEIGLVGKPNSGKSSFFKAATMIDVKVSPVPFTTIEPNTGMAHVVIDCVEKEFNTNCKPKHGYCKNGKRYIPVKLWDIAGLVPGAHEGKGLGSKFLDDVRQASVLIQVIDTSGMTDNEGKPTTNHDPSEEIRFLQDEIDLWFSDIIDRALKKIGAKSKMESKDNVVNMLHEQLTGLNVSKDQIDRAFSDSGISDVRKFATIIRKMSKPMLVAANKMDMENAQKNFEKLMGIFKEMLILPTSAEAEIALRKAAEKNLVDYDGKHFQLKDGVDERQKTVLNHIQKVVDMYGSTGVQECLNKTVFQLLDHIVVYPVEDENKLCDKDKNVLPDALLMPNGSTALDMAYKVHTSIGEKFISAIDARTKKRVGKDHILKNGDVIKIVAAR